MIKELIDFIRDFCQDPKHLKDFAVGHFIWGQLCTTLDTIEDTELAIESYSKSPFPDDAGERYLRIYGVLQAIYVQQDALRHLAEAITPTGPFELTDVLKNIRETRNLSVGHPTKIKRAGNLSAHAINRNSM